MLRNAENYMETPLSEATTVLNALDFKINGDLHSYLH